jgi:ATP/maltotriose-dependent transcriptional regulator MalT
VNPAIQSAEKIEALLLELLEPIRHSDDTLLHFEIDSRAIAEPVWKNFVASLSREEIRQWENWELIRNALSNLVRQTLDRHSGGTAIPGIDEEFHPPSDETTMPSLGAWFKRLVDLMQGIDQRTLQILALRIEGFNDRDISEQLGTGLRCIQRIAREMQLAWNAAPVETH